MSQPNNENKRWRSTFLKVATLRLLRLNFRSAYALVKFGPIKHLVSVQKTSWFGLKYLSQKHLEMENSWFCRH